MLYVKNDDSTTIPCVCVCRRDDIIPAIKVRKAMVRDSDKLMPLFDKEASKELESKYGQYFVADLIENSSKDDKLLALVVESNDEIVGFVCLTTNVDLSSVIQSCFVGMFDNFLGMFAVMCGLLFVVFGRMLECRTFRLVVICVWRLVW